MAETPKQPVAKAVVKPKAVAVKPVPEKLKAIKATVAKPAAKKLEPGKIKQPVAAATGKAEKPAKTVKVKMVRDTFSMSAPGYALLMQIRKSCKENGLKVKKGEIVCAAISLLSRLSSVELAQAIQATMPPRRT